MPITEASIHEVDFCSQIASAANSLFAQDPHAHPFAEARIEGYGTGRSKRKRKDLRFFEPDGKLALCGEVKLPGTSEGQSPYNEKVVRDAHEKADNAGVRFFFTWNVNVFVLWDRSHWDRPLLDRRVRQWRLGLNLSSPVDVARPQNLDFIRNRFLPDILRDLAEIYSGRRVDWSMPPDDIFIRSLESHLDWPVQLTTTYLIKHANRSKSFDAKVQQWLKEQQWIFVRNVPEEWHKALENMAKTLAYVWANRLIFYKALRARFSDLPRLTLPRSVKTADDAAKRFDRLFKKAVDRSGDYEPLLFPATEDWASGLVFKASNALDAWGGMLRGIESVDFSNVPSDIVGRIFQKLIGPEERHRYGQHFTGDDVVDLVNSFCIHRADDKVLDPACGSGSFLVRAYYRKRHLDPARDHLQQLADLFGCDIALYPAHLATLNLAAREINKEANYPRIARRNFFDTERGKQFCQIPDASGQGNIDVQLPILDAIVGNPPYVRQEKIEKDDKKDYDEKATRAWSGLKLSGRSDLHCYFWPVASKLLKADGYFGFLTSSSWLDVEYGFALQGWILRRFKVLAVMESAAEPWFVDARVKTCITILQRCDDEAERMANLCRFVRFSKPLKETIAVASGDNESARQKAVENLRDRILSATANTQNDDLRIVVKQQQALWDDGVRAGSTLQDATTDDGNDEGNREALDSDTTIADDGDQGPLIHLSAGDYVAGKWGRYIRAPDFYFEVMRRFGNRFVPLGEIATIRRGITSGCDAFFMPKDVTDKLLQECGSAVEFRRRSGGAKESDVESGKLRIIQAGDGSVHPIEAEYIAPEVHSLMKVDRPIVRAKDIDRVVLLVGEPMRALRGTWVYRYLKYGEQVTFESTKSKAVPVPERSTCAARDPWYDLTRLVRPGFAFWPMAQQYRHIIAGNPERLICNHNLFDLSSAALSKREENALWAALNCTMMGLFKTFYGRYAGTEGNLKTEVVDVNLLEVPDPRGVSNELAKKLVSAVRRMSRRSVGRLVEEQLMKRHSLERARRLAAGQLILSNELVQDDRWELDEAVFELLGVPVAKERGQLVQRLHKETARHFREIRVIEIEKQEQRAKTGSRRFSVQELAADTWDAAELADVTPLIAWIRKQPECSVAVNIPEERPAELSPTPMFDPDTVYFGKMHEAHMDCQSRGQAELAVRLANLGISGRIKVPADLDSCVKLLDRVDDRLDRHKRRFEELASSRISDPHLHTQIVDQLLRWFVLGREIALPAVDADVTDI